MAAFIGCDLGAESGRIMLGIVSAEKFTVEEVFRFPNGAIEERSHLVWNIDALRHGIQQGVERAAAKVERIEGISTDSWGVDYVLLDERGNIIPPVYHYRDQRCKKGLKLVLEQIGWERLFELTGIQLLPFNTIFQLATEDPARLKQARYILGIADAFNYMLGGRICYEVSLASTTQLYSPITQGWCDELIEQMGFPKSIFPEIVSSGTIIGELKWPDVRHSKPIPVIASCSHDTAAAVAAVPAQGDGWAYLSSGTWSLMGVELDQPLIKPTVRERNFTNEIGFNHKVRFLKNIIGLWLVQECKRQWEREGRKYDYAQLTQMAENAMPFKALIDPSDERFLPPGDMPSRIREYCKETSQQLPETEGELVRCILESLALFYRYTIEEIEQLLNKKIKVLHIVGGGSKNRVLNQFTANAIQILVLTGPVEATAIGNIAVQAIATGLLGSLSEARSVIKDSFGIEEVIPDIKASSQWDEAYERFLKLIKK